MILGLTFGACEQRSEVARDMEDLKNAQTDAPNVARQLEQRLKDAKAEVELEKKTELAQHGITDEVLKQRDELKHEEQDASKEVKEAEGGGSLPQRRGRAGNPEARRNPRPARRGQRRDGDPHRAAATEQTQPEHEEKQITIRRARVTEERGAKSSPKEGPSERRPRRRSPVPEHQGNDIFEVWVLRGLTVRLALPLHLRHEQARFIRCKRSSREARVSSAGN